MWDVTIGGSALQGESSYQAVRRVSKEERIVYAETHLTGRYDL